MPYVDGFVIPIAKNKVQMYRRMAAKAGKVWKKYGALEFRECVGDDLNIKSGTVPFPRRMKAKRSETVFFSWIMFKSKADRNRINKKVMQDPAMLAMMDPNDKTMNPRRMLYGGFKVVVDL